MIGPSREGLVFNQFSMLFDNETENDIPFAVVMSINVFLVLSRRRIVGRSSFQCHHQRLPFFRWQRNSLCNGCKNQTEKNHECIPETIFLYCHKKKLSSFIKNDIEIPFIPRRGGMCVVVEKRKIFAFSFFMSSLDVLGRQLFLNESSPSWRESFPGLRRGSRSECTTKGTFQVHQGMQGRVRGSLWRH